MVKVDGPVPLTDAGLKLPLAPEGRPLTPKITVPVNPFSGDTVTVAYTQPGSNRLRDVAVNNTATFGAQSATNNTLGVNPDVPSLVSPADSAIVGTATPTLSAQFSDAVLKLL